MRTPVAAAVTLRGRLLPLGVRLLGKRGCVDREWLAPAQLNAAIRLVCWLAGSAGLDHLPLASANHRPPTGRRALVDRSEVLMRVV